MSTILVLKNSIMEYDWGSRTFIPELTGEPSSAESPQAEMWMGAHPRAPSMIFRDGGKSSLIELIDTDPEGALGPSVAGKFSNKLPFLFKVLAAARPLSIQAHPDREQARKGFNRENRGKIGLGAPERNYRDENHKPELICALRPFWALKGFRRIEEILRLMERVGAQAKDLGLGLLRDRPEEEGLKRFFVSLMTMDKERQGRVLKEVVAVSNDRADDPGKVFEWIGRLNQDFPGDMGALSPLFMNLVRLDPGEAMYISPGEPHAYLEGAGLELMANSDNVIRGGLTSKHTDLNEFADILDYSPHRVEILRPRREGEGVAVYQTDAEEFMLERISLSQGKNLYESPQERSAEIMICTEGEARLTDQVDGAWLDLSRGVSVFVPAAVRGYSIRGEATIYRAFVPLESG